MVVKQFTPDLKLKAVNYYDKIKNYVKVNLYLPLYSNSSNMCWFSLTNLTNSILFSSKVGIIFII